MKRIADFAQTGNIEISCRGHRELIGQYADGRMTLKAIYRDDPVAKARINLCKEIVAGYGLPEPAIQWIDG